MGPKHRYRPMTNVILSPWKGGTPRRIANSLGFRLLCLRDLHKIPGRRNKVIVPGNIGILINWGCTNILDLPYRYLWNAPVSVRIASNKLLTFKCMVNDKIPTLDFTEDYEKAKAWNVAHSVVGHHDLHGHSGDGLTLFKKEEGISPESDSGIELYTCYFPKKKEVRVHVFDMGDDRYSTLYLEKKRVLDPDKKKERGLEPDEKADTFIRTWENGWIYARDVISDPKAVNVAKRAIRATGLKFGAVDLLVRDGDIRVGEINTAPGLEGQALEFYTNNFREIFGMRLS